MQVPAEDVIASLTAQVGQLNTDLVVERLMNQKLSEELRQLKTATDSPQLPIEGTVV